MLSGVSPPSRATLNATSRLLSLLGPRFWRWGVLALTTLLAVGITGHWVEKHEMRQKAAALRQAAEIYTLALRGIAEKHDHLPYVIGQHPDVQALLLDSSNRPLADKVSRHFADLKQHADVAVIYVIAPSGMTLAASNWDGKDSFVGQSYEQRPYFQEALQGRRSHFYGVGLTTGVPGLFIAEPVRREGRIIGVMAIKVGIQALATAWATSTEPVVLQDGRGIVFLSSVADWLYRSRQPLSPADLAWVSTHGQYGKRSTYDLLPWQVLATTEPATFRVETRLEGRRASLLVLDSPVPELGWTLTVTSSLGDLEPAVREAQVLAGLLLAVLLLGGLYWRLRERRFAEQRQAQLELEKRIRERTHDLQEAHAFRKAMEDSLLVGMRARDPEGRIIYVNPALCEMVGYPAEELLGSKPPYPYWHPEHMDRHWNENDVVLNGRSTPHGYESRFRHRSGRDVIVMIYTAPLIDAEGRHQGWMSSVVDITAQKEAEARQLEQERQLQRSARLASLGEMASTLAHELNQPLMALSNFSLAAQAMARQAGQPFLVSALDDIVAQSRRASEIVKRIRGFIRTQGACFEACDMGAILAQVTALLQPELQRCRTTVENGLAEHSPKVSGDPILLQQVLINLMQNAMQAMQEREPTRRVITVEAQVTDSALGIRILDQGPGIPEALRDQVFAPFFSTKEDGLGLGLNICRTIIEAHGGRLVARNRAEGGAEFAFTLPLHP